MSALLNSLQFVPSWPSSTSSEAEPRLEQSQDYSQVRSSHFEVIARKVREDWTRAPLAHADLNSQNILLPPRAFFVVAAMPRPNVTIGQSEEMRWLTNNRSIVSQHRGEWLLIERSSLIAHSADFDVIRKQIQNRGIRSPFVYYVPTERETNFVSI